MRQNIIVLCMIWCFTVFGCSSILDFEGKQRDGNDSFDVADSDDEEAEDAPGEPDAVATHRVVLFSDGGGGLSQNGQYVIRGGITALSCSESINDSYVLESCGIEILSP